MVQNPTLYVNSFALTPVEKVILNGVISIRLRGKKAQPGWKEMGVWISRTTRTVHRALSNLEQVGLLRWRRRGKRLTNVYWIASSLWRRLIAGRKIRKEAIVKETNEPVDAERAKVFFSALIAKLGPPGRRGALAA